MYECCRMKSTATLLSPSIAIFLLRALGQEFLRKSASFYSVEKDLYLGDLQ